MESPSQKILSWIHSRPGVFALREEGSRLRIQELYSRKELSLEPGDLVHAELQANRLKPDEDYLLLKLDNGASLALSPQGFAFAPNFANTGPLSLPSEVYCLQDFESLLAKLKHLVQEPDRRRDALDLLMVLIAILDGAKAVGIAMDAETREVEAQLSLLEARQ